MNDITASNAADSPDGALDLFAGAPAEQVKQHVAKKRAEIERQRMRVQKDMDRQRREMEAKRAAMEAEFRRASAELEAQMAPLRAELTRMEEMGQIVDLYLGRGEQVEVVREGKPASADEPIVIRQRVLAMSEEAAILFDGEDGYNGLDYRDVDQFIDWLQEPSHLDQLLPEPKCVVVLVPTRESSNASNIWEAAAHDAANRKSYWFMRNGDRVTLMRTDTIVVGDRLVPKRDEFVTFFADRAGRPMEPGSPAWVKAEEAADARRRHFMKLMLTLQGLVDRTSTWHPLPADGVNLLSVASQDIGRVRIVNELDMILTDGRESFRDWQKRLNGQLRPGHRVIGDWRSKDFAFVNGVYDEWERNVRHTRIYPQTAPKPQSSVLHTIEGTRDGMLVIRYERTDEVVKRNVPVPDQPGYVYRERFVKPTQRASCLINPSDTWVLPFDLATVDELTYYLNSREARTDFLSMVPVVRAALAAKEAEAQAEAPFRDLLAREITTEGCPAEDAEATVDRLVHTWKVRNKYGRALIGDSDHEAKASREILATYRAERKLARDDERMIAAARRATPSMICVGATKSGVWRAYAPSQPAHDPGVFLDVFELSKDGAVKSIEHEKVVASRHRPAHVAWNAPEWETWKFDANPRHYMPHAAREAFIEQARQKVTAMGWTPVCVTEYFDPSEPERRELVAYGWTPEKDPATYHQHTGGDLGWHSAHTQDGHPIGSLMFRVTPSQAGDPVMSLHHESTHATFSEYSATYRDHEGIPWWPDDARRYGEARPRLLWVDDAVFDELHAWSLRAKAAAEDERAQRDKRHTQFRRYADAMNETLHAQHIADLHAQFIEDYGEDADDVWEHHLSTLRLDPQPLHPALVASVLEATQQRGESFVGRSLNELAQLYNDAATKAFLAGHGHRPSINFREHGTVLVPDLDQDETS